MSVAVQNNDPPKGLVILFFVLLLLLFGAKLCSAEPIIRVHYTYKVIPEYEVILDTDIWVDVENDTLTFGYAKFEVLRISWKINGDVFVTCEWYGGKLYFKFLRNSRILEITNGRVDNPSCWIYIEEI